MHLFPSRSSAAEARATSAESVASLLRTIESEIIPRLMLAHGCALNDPAGPAPSADRAVTDEAQVAELAELVMHQDVAVARAFVASRRRAGLSVEALFLELLAPAARRLGVLWEADLCDFTQVTVGLWRLQVLVHEHAFEAPRTLAPATVARHVLLMAAPGSQHTFGLLLVGEFFRREGWHVEGDPTLSVDEAAKRVAAAHFDTIGISVGSECHADAVTSAILALRQASLNPAVVVMIGGPVVTAAWVPLVGADASAPDAAEAVAVAGRLVAARLAHG